MSAPTVRVLPPEEWPRLAGVTPYDVSAFDPAQTIVVVVERAGTIVAAWMALNTVHLEGLYIAPDARHHPGVGKALFLGMHEALTLAGVSQALTIAQDPAIERLATKAGFTRIPGALFALKVR